MNPIPHPASVLGPSSSDVTKEGVVGVFWDYESCPRPQEYAGSIVVQCIQAAALAYGSIGVFNVYADLETRRTNPRITAGLGAKGLREEFHSLGVSVLDCPAKSGETSADLKMIIVDLFAFASVNRRLATLVVISADPDLAYTLSLLRQRHFKVILISQSLGSLEIGAALGSQADVLLKWEAVLKGKPRLPSGSTQDISQSCAVTSVPGGQELSEGDKKPLPSPTQTVTSANRPAIRLNRAASGVSPATSASKSPSLVAPSVQPTTTSSTPTATSHNASIPEHLREMIALLATARKVRGWPEPNIRHETSRKLKVSLSERTVLGYLEEGIRLGMLTKTIRPPKGGRSQPLTYYAVKPNFKGN